MTLSPSTESGERLMDAQEAFEASVPTHLQEDVMQMIAEAASGWSEHASVTILERDRHDAINVTAHGIVTVEGVEHRFIVDDDNPARLGPQQPKSYCQGSLGHPTCPAPIRSISSI